MLSVHRTLLDVKRIKGIQAMGILKLRYRSFITATKIGTRTKESSFERKTLRNDTAKINKLAPHSDTTYCTLCTR